MKIGRENGCTGCTQEKKQSPSAKMSNRVGVNLRASAYLHQGDRKYMEDEFQIAYQRTLDKKDIEYAFFGIFDGHGGKEAANFAKDHLMDNIVSLRSFWSDNDDDVLSAIKEGFIQTHHAMWKMLDKWPRTSSGWPSTSGTTASIAFIRRQKIYIGHVGDSGIVLGFESDNRNWLGELLTTDHKPESADENARIKESGGKVVSKSGVPRVVWNRPKSGHLGPVRRSTPMDEIPFLAVARSLGDLWSYNPNNNQFVVSPEPDVCVINIDINRHRCLIFGTDGLWNVLSPTTAVSIAHYTEKNNELHYMADPLECGKPRLWMNPSRSIVKSGALDRYQRVSLRADNTSAVTVFLDPPGPPKRDVLLQQVAWRKGNTLKGSLFKPPVKKPNSEASVQVHVYNVDPKEEGSSRDRFPVKEKLPEDWQNKDTWKPDGVFSVSPEEPDKTPPPPTPPPRSTSQVSSAAANERLLDQLYGNKCDADAKCSECGCSNDGAATEGSPGDDIQIPVVSSSTAAQPKPSSDSVKEYLKRMRTRSRVNAITDLWHLRRAIPDTDKLRAPRRSIPATEESSNPSNSPISYENFETLPPRVPLLPPKNENTEFWQGLRPKPKASTSRHKSISPLPTYSSNRVLRSINGSPKVQVKRKRPRDSMGVEPNSKSMRIHTRSHTWSHKSIVTRSQEKTMKCKPK